jgi:hypothetical protein
MSDESNPSPGGWPTPSESEDLRRKPREASGDFTVVYTLLDPRDARIAYVGACRDPKGNLRKLVFDAKRITVGHTYDWIRGLLAGGLRPVVTLVREVPRYTAKDYIQAHKKLIGFVDLPRRTRGPALKSPRDLKLDRCVTYIAPHFPFRRTVDQRDKYVCFVKQALRRYGPKLKSTRHSKIVIPPNTPEMREIARKTALMILKSKSWKKPRN